MRVPAAVLILVFSTGAALAANNDQQSDRAKGQNTSKGQDTSGVRVTEVRNWSVIDTDKDGYISPQEMEQYLTQVWERRKASTANTEEKKSSQ